MWKELFSDPILKEKIALVAVDEAHCISEWLIIIFPLHFTCSFMIDRGTGFRDSVKKMGGLRAHHSWH